MKRLAALADREVLTVVGLMSGTSVDGIDAAVVDLSGPADAPVIRQRAFRTEPWDDALREALLSAAAGERGSASEVARLDAAAGEAFGRAALAAMTEAGLGPGDVDLVGSHGQTILHEPEEGRTWQVGAPTRIAALVGAPVVSDFRTADLVAGGQGAPLVPLLDARLFRHPERGRVLLNLGGMANLTALPPGKGLDGVIAFDTGPGNVLLDEFVRHATRGARRRDEDGRAAAAGRVDEDLLAGFLSHPYFREAPPKSTGRESFGEAFVALTLAEWAARRETFEDIAATLTELTARSVAHAIERWVAPAMPVDELLVSGGGAHNPTLLARIGAVLDGPDPVPLESVGFSSDAKEALAFAFLARETVCGRPGNVPGATGAARAVVLGTITPAPGV